MLISFCALVWAQTPTPAPSPTPKPTPQIKYITLPVPTPTPFQPNELHQWGAVTLFHGLPSDRVRAITQGPDGAMWFGTDAGLARYDGRRTQAMSAEGLPTGRISALLTDEDGALWIGTENGAARFANGVFAPIPETKSQGVNAILLQARGRVWLATAQGQVFDCQATDGNGFTTRALLTQPLPSADADKPGLLTLTSLAYHNNTLYAGSLSRGIFAIRDDGAAQEVHSRPRSYFINALLTANNLVWTGASAGKKGKGAAIFYDPLYLDLANETTGTVNALHPFKHEFGGYIGVWAATDGNGVFKFYGGKDFTWQKHFTFENTAGGLRSDHVFSVFVDREDVVWFGTDKGVSRYDPHAPEVENIGESADSNFIRAFASDTGIDPGSDFSLVGTNRGLFAFKPGTPKGENWRLVPGLERNAIYAIIYAKANDYHTRVLAGTSGGLYETNIIGAPDDMYTLPGNPKPLQFRRLTTNTPTGADISGSGVRAIAFLRGTPYFSTYGRGLERWDGNHATLVWPTNGDATREVISLTEETNKRLWLGTANAGIFVFDGQGARAVPELAELAGRAVRRIALTPQGLWLATARGLYFYREGSAPRLVAPDVEARDVQPLDGYNVPAVWCATVNSGVLKIVLDEKFGPLISRLDVEQGLPSQSAFALSGNLLIGTNRGLVRYEPGNTPPTLTATRILSKRVHTPEEARAGLRLE